MDIPHKIKQTLEKDQTLHSKVLESVTNFEPWFKANRLVFFDEYTDHGLDHVQRVMAGAAELIVDDALEVLGPEDFACLMNSILLHDCAMHLSKDGLLRLVDGNDWNPLPSDFFDEDDDVPWPELWYKYSFEVSRFDKQTLEAITGKPDRVKLPRKVVDLNESHYPLVGEFLRRHHARLAHEIALGGVPGSKETPLNLGGRWKRRQLDLAGLVARSHNLDLREAVDRLGRLGSGRQKPGGVYAPFLMCLVRIADYLEMDDSRAPVQILKVRSLRSPVSQMEWQKHQAVYHISKHEDDPEAIFIDIDPDNLENVKSFLALKAQLAGLQNELDGCWAVLGEVYRELPLGLSIRRVRSTLDESKAFSKHLPFVPIQASFVASGDILKLLVGPLYNDEPAYAIRELIQNAVDACLEREDYCDRYECRNIKFQELDADIIVTLREEAPGKYPDC